MKILCALGEHNYGDPSRGEGYEYVNFLPALRNLGHEVVFFESFSKSAYRDFAELNRKFLETVQSEKPDVILCVLLGYEIWLETLALVREGTDAVLINWSTDDSWKYEQFSRYVAPAFHIYATTYLSAVAKAKANGHDNFFLSQWAASSARLAEPLPASRCRYPVSFVGTAYGNRPRWIAGLKERGFDVTCFGYGWEHGTVSADRIPEIIRDSVLSLNFGDSGTVINGGMLTKSRQIKARVFEVPGAGGCLMTESAEYLDRYYRIGDEISVFDGIDDLAVKIGDQLRHPDQRDRIAMAGYLRTKSEHTYEARFSDILEKASRIKADLDGTGYRIDFDRFERIACQHRAGPLLRIISLLLLLPCVMIWGRKRGPRAARRFLFEASWRIVGKKTYSVSGWPGRLFYRES